MATTPKPMFDPFLVPTVAFNAYQVPVGTTGIVKHLAAHNTTADTVELTVYLVENGGTASSLNQIFRKKIAGYDGKIIFEAINATLEAGASLQVIADTVSAISMHGGVNEVVS